MLGTDSSVRALTLHKYHPAGKEPSGSILGSGRITKGGILHASLVMESIPLFRVQSLGALRSETEGTVSGIAVFDGNLDTFAINSDVDVTPVRIRGTPLGPSHLHVHATQVNPPAKAQGKTRCGAPVAAPFDKEAYLNDTSSHGDVVVDGDVAGGAVHLDHFDVTRAPKPVITGSVLLKGLDLGALNRVLTPPEHEAAEDLAVPEGAPKDEIEGNVSGALTLEHVQVGSLEHAKAHFAPTALTIARGIERIVLRPTPEIISLDEDRVSIPNLVFDLEAARGLKGAVTVHGSVTHATRDPELALGMDLSPIDLGLFVGVVPKLERAAGTLQGSVTLTGKMRAPAVNGDVRVAGGELQVKGLPSVVSELNVDLRASAEELRIAKADAKFAGGTVSMRGAVPLKQLFDGVGDAQVSARGIHLTPADGVTATADADVTISLNAASSEGPTAKLPRISGDVVLTQFEYARPINLTTDSQRVRGPRQAHGHRDVRPLARRDGVRDPRPHPRPARHQEQPGRGAARHRLGRARGHRDEPAHRPARRARRRSPGGRFHFQANDFDVRQGLIRFDDPTRIAPNVDVTAVTEYRRYTDTSAARRPAGASSTGAGLGGSAGGARRLALADHAPRLRRRRQPARRHDERALALAGGHRAAPRGRDDARRARPAPGEQHRREHRAQATWAPRAGPTAPSSRRSPSSTTSASAAPTPP